MTVVLILVIIVGAIIFTKMNDRPSYYQTSQPYNSPSYNATKSALEYKYSEFITLLNSGHQESKVIERGANKLVLGVRNYGGSTTWHLNENRISEDLDITYKVRNNPSFPDVTLHFSFTQDTCVNNPEKAFLKINELIEAEIVKLLSRIK
jgi:hypothetical protein